MLLLRGQLRQLTRRLSLAFREPWLLFDEVDDLWRSRGSRQAAGGPQLMLRPEGLCGGDGEARFQVRR